MQLTRKATGQISEDLLERLLVALHPLDFTPNSGQYEIGYFCAQRDFRCILTDILNSGELPEAKPVTRKWWTLWR